MESWGSYHRIAVASLSIAVTFAIVAQPGWVLWLGALYLGLSAAMPAALEAMHSLRLRYWTRIALILVDTLAVSMFVYQWGARCSPAPIMYVPVVSGWTLLHQRHLGRVAGAAVLLAYAGMLYAEQRGWSLRDPTELAALSLSPGSNPLIYFTTLACAIIAVHWLVDFTVARLHEHTQLVSRLTAEKHTREREGQLVIQLEEAQRLEALGRLAGGVAHDFNNLLTVLMGCAELAELNLAKNPGQAGRALADLQNAAERGAGLTAQLLDFASRRPASPRHVDLNISVPSSVTLLERLLDAKVELRVSKSREPCVVHLDPSGLERLLLNLAVNARDAMPMGGVLSLSISTRTLAGEQLAVLEVSDTGSGIPSADLPHIFEPFFTTKARGKGTGLGLSSVYGLVKQSQGQIEVESRLHVGTTFRILWPRVHGRASMQQARHSLPTHGDELILLVDDDEEVRSIVLSQLESAGYTVLSAALGEAALQLLAQHGAEVRMLVSDVSMPGMSGIELARQVHDLAPTMPILLISGYSEELYETRENKERIGRFLAKPFSGQQLLTEVRQALDQRSNEPSRSADLP